MLKSTFIGSYFKPIAETKKQMLPLGQTFVEDKENNQQIMNSNTKNPPQKTKPNLPQKTKPNPPQKTKPTIDTTSHIALFYELTKPNPPQKTKPKVVKKSKKLAKNEKAYQCEVCPRGFDKKSDLKMHSKVHSGLKAYSCDVCPKSFPKMHDLILHQKSHAGVKNFKCDDCGKKFLVVEKLSAHKQIHLNNKSSKDDPNDFSFYPSKNIPTDKVRTASTPKRNKNLDSPKRSRDLGSPKRSISTPQQTKTTCDHCPKSFAESWKLKMHMWTHTREKTYHCDLCTKSFSSLERLNGHKNSDCVHKEIYNEK